jgi:hypothetical protein
MTLRRPLQTPFVSPCLARKICPAFALANFDRNQANVTYKKKIFQLVRLLSGFARRFDSSVKKQKLYPSKKSGAEYFCDRYSIARVPMMHAT